MQNLDVTSLWEIFLVPESEMTHTLATGNSTSRRGRRMWSRLLVGESNMVNQGYGIYGIFKMSGGTGYHHRLWRVPPAAKRRNLTEVLYRDGFDVWITVACRNAKSNCSTGHYGHPRYLSYITWWNFGSRRRTS